MKSQLYKLKVITKDSDADKVAKDVREISNYLQEDSSLLQLYIEICLSSILPFFGKTFPVDTKLQSIDYWLLQPKLEVISTIISCLKNPNSQLTAVYYLSKWTNSKIFSNLIDTILSTGKNENYSELLSIIFSIPDQVAAIYYDILQNEKQLQAKKDNQSEETQNKEENKETKETKKRVQIITDEQRKMFTETLEKSNFFTKLAKSLTNLDPILISKFSILNLTQYLWNTKFTEVQFAESALNLQPSAVSPFISSLIEDKPKEFATAVLSVLYPNVDRVKKLIRNHFLTQKVLSQHAQDTLIAFLIGQGEVISTIELCGEIWSRHVLITQMSTGLHSQLSHIILAMLDKVTKEEIQNCKATSLIMSGVTAHIGISSPEIRKEGLMIGEKITHILLPDQPVKFDELHPEDDQKEKEEKEKTEKLLSKPPESDQPSSDDEDKELDIDESGKKELTSRQRVIVTTIQMKTH
ncbi:hypothetical protein TVAG_226400 [Trichomonas vaginalis G3]|uniref:Uncharacterized protein n=1 Tax=Trichomonas vaginalis (strain ATCC PRA-98 / G3) TaxID=412133 RepID=A2ER74_TRIV3|nr:hypothetical protein TVAG_226400 [Trichomonas vaginalis G3]|eukprot:XP_001317050.1 hypothetical protein [Trichomonas vaginalis G3]